MDEGEGADHGADPEAKQERVAVLSSPFPCDLQRGLAGIELCGAFLFALLLAELLGVVENVVAGRCAVGGDDSWKAGQYTIRQMNSKCSGRISRTDKSSGGGDKESTEGDGEGAERRKSSAGGHHAHATNGRANDTTNASTPDSGTAQMLACCST